MFFTSARLQNYRSYIDSSFEFDKGVNIIVGPNASGKTNLLDALHFIATGFPIRTSQEFIINNQHQWAKVDVLNNKNQERSIKLKINERTEIVIDNKSYKRLSVDTKIPIVLFEPGHLYQITTAPEQRRMFLDDILNKVDNEFISVKNNYTRVLRQRNSLLKKQINEVKQQIFAWDVRLSEIAGKYIEKRQNLIELINNQISNIYSEIANKKHKLQLNYESKSPTSNYASSLLKLLQTKLETDYQRGFTNYGPHRDDISVIIDGKDIRGVASRGETRSILLSLKVFEARLLKKVYNQKPLLLLDDVFGELDGSRRKSLIEFMSSSQTFITTTDADIIGHDFIQRNYIIYL